MFEQEPEEDKPLNIDFTLRRWQADVRARLKKFNVLIVSRGAGKTFLCSLEIMLRALAGPARAEYIFLGPYKNQMHRNVWSDLTHIASLFPNTYVNNNRLEIIFQHNKARITVLGADDPESLRGKHVHGMIIDEFDDMPPMEKIWPIIFPMTTNHDAWVIMVGTPKGRRNLYQKLNEAVAAQAEGDNAWYHAVLDHSKTRAFKPEQIEHARKTMSLDMFRQEFECFPPGSLVAVADNVMPIETITVGDLVMTHTGHLRKVTNVMQREYDGELVIIRSFGSRPLRLTPEHPVRVCDPSSQEYDWKAAKDITTDDWLVTPKKHRGMPVISSALAELIAWFIAEGCVSGNSINFSLGAHETTFVRRVQDCLAALGRDSTELTKGPVTSVICNDVALGDFLISTCGSGAHNKRIPLSLICGHEQVVFDTLIDGDGHIKVDARNERTRPCFLYTTTSEVLIQQMQLLAATLDLAGTYQTVPAHECIIEGRRCNASESYTAQFYKVLFYDVKKNPATKIRAAKNGVLGRVRSIEREYYHGPVHNLSVIGDESYVVNARAVHNCSFEASNAGAYYSRQISELRTNGNIIYDGSLYDPNLETHVGFDIGIRDFSAIWLWQLKRDRLTGEDNIHFIDFEQAPNLGLPDWADVIRKKERDFGYRRGSIVFPHDIKVREWGAGVSRLEASENLGLHPEICPDHRVEDRIELMRLHLPKCKFDGRRCEEGIECLAQYKEKMNKNGVGMGVPDKNDGVDHAADSAGYCMIYAKQVMNQPSLVRVPLFRRR